LSVGSERIPREIHSRRRSTVDGIRADENEMFKIRSDAVLQIRSEVMEGIRSEVIEEIKQTTRCDVDVNRAIY
jgi:hypothetical protein